ncbi:MAG: metalloregulator ArsR/SmtB family transcription factor [Patescibacteria group bacterium]|jgi:DNA-binding transcriptional ArsR family regulator
MLKDTQIARLRKALSRDKEKLPEFFDALADKSRYRIFLLLLENKGLCVTDIAKVLGISVPAASQQFKILEKASVVQRERMGQMTCYCVDTTNPTVKSIIKLIGEK